LNYLAPIAPVLLGIVLSALAPAGAVTLRLCTDQHSHLPHVTPNGEGSVDILIREAAEAIGLDIESHAAPTTRCREELRTGVADAFPITPFTASLLPFVAFPMNGAQPDPTRAVLNARAMVYRRVGTVPDWDGSRFSQLQTPVLVPAGAVLLLDRLTAMGVPIERGAMTLDGNFAKLLARRADLAIGSEISGRVLMALPEFTGKIEMLPLPFTDELYYLGLSRRFRDANPELTDKLWDAIARIRRTPAYQKTARRMADEAARSLKE
jgi:polar amino acid transport system substrate-binding protein